MAYPWKDLDDTWYAALVGASGVYNLARRRPVNGPQGPTVDYEVIDRTTGAWKPTPAGAGYFTGIGGVTDAEPISRDQAAELAPRIHPAARIDD